MSFLGIDIGTSGLRLLLIGEDGAPIGAAERSYPTAHPDPGWSEQDPADWVAALDAAMAELHADHPAVADITGIGVAGHMHGATLLGADGTVLRPCILWNDTRSHKEAAALDALPAFREISGNIVFPGFTAPKLEWVRMHEPSVFAATKTVLLPASYLNFHLTGERVSDCSDSAGTAWFDVAGRCWSDTLLHGSHMRADQMPRVGEGSAPAGTLRAALARKWGIKGAPVVAGGAGDNAAAACGLGVLEEGQGFVSLGTSGVVLRAGDQCTPMPKAAVHTFCHAVPDRWYQMGVMLSAADSLTWLSSITGTPAKALTASLGITLHPPGRARFFPYLSGERTPHNDAAIRAGFVGIGAETGRDELTRAVLEGVSFGLRDCFETVRRAGGPFTHLFAIGGGSASRYWLSLLATVLNTPLHLPEGREFGAALGAARLGQAAATGEGVEAIMPLAPTAEIIAPVADLVPAYDAAYTAFRAGYPHLAAFPVGDAP